MENSHRRRGQVRIFPVRNEMGGWEKVQFIV